MCRIEGCLHTVRRGATPTKHVGQCWYDHGICGCCAVEFFPEGGYNHSPQCDTKIRKELAELLET